MKEINQAYGILGDPEKRKNYDQYGNKGDFAGGFNSGGGFGSDDSIFKDIFDTFFGREVENSSRKTSPNNRTNQQVGKDILISLTLTFKESILGTKKKVSLELEKACKDCRQTGAYSTADVIECSSCQGRGAVNTIQRTILGAIRTQITCSQCQGGGRIIKKKMWVL